MYGSPGRTPHSIKTEQTTAIHSFNDEWEGQVNATEDVSHTETCCRVRRTALVIRNIFATTPLLSLHLLSAHVFHLPLRWFHSVISLYLVSAGHASREDAVLCLPPEDRCGRKSSPAVTLSLWILRGGGFGSFLGAYSHMRKWIHITCLVVVKQFPSPFHISVFLIYSLKSLLGYHPAPIIRS